MDRGRGDALPSSFDADATLQLLLADHASHPEDATHIRYVSFAHPRPRGCSTRPRERGNRVFDALRAFTEMPVPVDGSATLYRLDTRQGGWDSRELFVQETKDTEGLFPSRPTIWCCSNSHAVAPTPALAEYIAKAKLARPVPLVPADWLAGMLKKDRRWQPTSRA